MLALRAAALAHSEQLGSAPGGARISMMAISCSTAAACADGCAPSATPPQPRCEAAMRRRCWSELDLAGRLVISSRLLMVDLPRAVWLLDELSRPCALQLAIHSAGVMQCTARPRKSVDDAPHANPRSRRRCHASLPSPSTLPLLAALLLVLPSAVICTSCCLGRCLSPGADR